MGAGDGTAVGPSVEGEGVGGLLGALVGLLLGIKDGAPEHLGTLP